MKSRPRIHYWVSLRKFYTNEGLELTAAQAYCFWRLKMADFTTDGLLTMLRKTFTKPT